MSNTNSSPAPANAGGSPAQLEHIRGVFSTQDVKKVGTGTTTRKTVQKSFWFVEQRPDGKIDCQPVNANYVPSGPKRTITMEELINKFAPEPEFYVNSVYPKMQEQQRTLDAADAHREKGETFAAEYAYDVALRVDEDNVRANFGIGLTYLQRGEKDKAENIFERLVKLEAAFEDEHKHLFNDFGINLRKSKMLAQAVVYYQRALELSQKDENLHINMARALLESNDLPGCASHVLQALALAPDNETAQKFLQWLLAKNLVSAEMLEEIKGKLASGDADVTPAPVFAPETGDPS